MSFVTSNTSNSPFSTPFLNDNKQVVKGVKNSFWDRRNIKVVIGCVLLVATAAIVMSCLLFIPGAPLAFAGAGIAGFVATKLGISFAAGIALSTAVTTGLPSLLAGGVALVSLALTVPKSRGLEDLPKAAVSKEKLSERSDPATFKPPASRSPLSFQLPQKSKYQVYPTTTKKETSSVNNF